MKKYFNRLTILQKIFVSSIIFALPIIVLLFYAISGFNHNIGLTRLELLGSRMLIPLQGLAELIPEHQLLVRLYTRGDKTAEEKVNLVARAVEKHFALLLKEGKELEDQLQVTEQNMKSAGLEQSHFSQIYKSWQELRSNWKTNVQSDSAHETVLRGIQTLVKRIANTSNIAIDSGEDTNDIIDVGFLSMPKIQDRLWAFILFAESVFLKGSVSREDAVRFASFASILENDIDHIRQSTQASLNLNKRLHGDNTTIQKNIQPLVAQYESSVIPFLAILSWLSNDPNFKMSIPVFLEPAKNVLNTGSTLRETAITEAQILLQKRIDKDVDRRFVALFLSLGSWLFASIMVIIISRGIARSLGRVVNIAGEIAGGNLLKATEDLEKTGKTELHLNGKIEESAKNRWSEIFRLFQAIAAMTSSLQSLLTQVGRSGIQVTASSTQIAASARQLEATVAEQASSINEVSVTSKEISATSQEFAKTMNRVAEMATEAAELASASMTSLSSINGTMKALLESTTESSTKLRSVKEKMENITQVITTITKVANQINLLSLNAAIEAEKAGEYGIGFSVVAREIRRLADQTAVSAIDIEALITETRDAMSEGVSAVETYTTQTRTSTEKIAEISVDLLRAIEHTQELVPQFEAANQGMQVQSQSAAQISESMGHLSQTAAQTRESLVEFRSVVEQLNEAARRLQDEVARFSIH